MNKRADTLRWLSRLFRQLTATRLVLLVVLAAEAGLSLSLLGRPLTLDESTYLVAGHAVLAHWMLGSMVLPYAQVLSGAPVIYPPLVALADDLGGLTLARLLSLFFIMAATLLLWSATRRLFGNGWIPVIAAALFATTAAAQFLGALATFDALSLVLLAGAAWCAVRAAEARGRGEYLLLAAVCVLLLAANATKYASALWDPIVIAVAALSSAHRRNGRHGLIAGLVTGAGTLALLGIAVFAAGPSYRQGITFTTTGRFAATPISASLILASAARWVGLIALLAVGGAIALSRSNSDRSVKALGWVLAAAAFLAPADQARIGVIVSLFKHVGFGAWFAAMPASYGICTAAVALSTWRRRKPELSANGAGGADRLTLRTRAVAAAAAVALVAVAGYGGSEARAEYLRYPVYPPSVIAQLKPMLAGTRGHWLGDTPNVIIYYTKSSPLRWKNTFGFVFYDRSTRQLIQGPAAYVAAIRRHYFDVVVLRVGYANLQNDRVITAALHGDPNYRLTVFRLHPYTRSVLVWRYVPRAPKVAG